MEEPENTLMHANCGGNVRRDAESDHYVCDQCHAEAEGVVSSAEKVQGRPEEVILCNPHDAAF
ncbi:MAG TPA: hypothetical protein VGK99_22925 [Acidobacteriota bacterium]|jgi:hypothetical protein